MNQLNPKTYDFDIKGNPYLGLAQEHQYGLLAQDVKQILPELIRDFTVPGLTDENGNYISMPSTHSAINYTPLISVLIAGFKKQQKEIADLKNQISNCCSSNSKKLEKAINVELTNSQTIILDQNNPNPFAEETNISYNIPETIQKAVILFYDAKGTVLKEVEIKEKVQGSIHVYAPDLSSGIYTYTLFADDKVIESKKMMKK